MSERYDPELFSSFEAIVRNRLSNRCTDWLRQHRGRTRWQFSGHTYERTIEQPVSLDAAAGEDGTLAENVGQVDAAIEALCAPAPFSGVLDDRDRDAVFDVARIRVLARRLASERSQRPRAA
jgi:hypothetical protein